MAELGLRFCVRAFSSCGKRGPLFIVVRRPLTIAAPLVAEHRLQTRRLSSCGSRAHLLRGMWDPPRPGLEPVSPALAVRFSTTAPPGKPPSYFYCIFWNFHYFCYYFFSSDCLLSQLTNKNEMFFFSIYPLFDLANFFELWSVEILIWGLCPINLAHPLHS